jgi:L-asparaginase II
VSGVSVVRGDVVESRHAVSVAVWHETEGQVGSVGDETAMTFYRSAAKPMQALPLVEEGVVGRFGLTPDELALCCASHEGELAHVTVARSILAKAGADESLLQCGAHAPFSPFAAQMLAEGGHAPERIHNNCSGKHAGMIAFALAMGWDPEHYQEAWHPVQQRMLTEVERWTGVARDGVRKGIDGCGIPCYAVPLDVMAASFARYAAAASRGEPAAVVVDAMTTNSFMVGGTGRTCTEVMDVAGDRVFVKLGAEGVYGGGVPSQGLGFAIKVPDGGRRAVEVALIRTLECLGVLDATEVKRLRAHANPDVMNTRGEIVGEIRAEFDLLAIGTAGA